MKLSLTKSRPRFRSCCYFQ